MVEENFPSLTKIWHSKPYDAIFPTRPELSVKGKVVVVTGGGGAIGAATAHSFAKAGSDKIAIIGRRREPLEETRSKIESDVSGATVLVVQGDLADAESMQTALDTVREQLGPVDIFIAVAGYLPLFAPVATADPEEWWRGFEINAKGAFNTARALISNDNSTKNCIVVDTSTCVVHMPAMRQASGYVSSKLASTKIWEIVGAESGWNMEVVHAHPGVVYSELNVKSGVTPSDDPYLPGNFYVWLCSPEAAWLRKRGKYVWVNWDVPELLSMKDELSGPDQLTITLQGWPFGQGADGSEHALRI